MKPEPRVSIHLFEDTLNLRPGSPWQIREVCDPVAAADGRSRVVVDLALVAGRTLHCPECGSAVPRYDVSRREWRHRDIFEHQCWVSAEVPRVKCPAHGVKRVKVPWAAARVGHTASFEAYVIGLLLDMPVSKVAARVGLSWPAIDGVLTRAVRRGLTRRNGGEIYPVLAVDEVSFRKRHRYFTVVTDPLGGKVLYVAEGREKQALAGFYQTLNRTQRQAIRAVSMDMWQAYIQATLEAVPGARRKIAFDRFHVSKKINEALNKVLRAQRRALRAQGDDSLVGTKYDWLRGPERKTHAEKLAFCELRRHCQTTARAWAMKETARGLWRYRQPTWARKAWLRLCNWLARSRLAPMVAVGRFLRKHLWGIVNAIVLKVSNGPAESMNSRIKTVKIRSRGFRNTNRFGQAILFHLGGLDLCPPGIQPLATHTEC